LACGDRLFRLVRFGKESTAAAVLSGHDLTGCEAIVTGGTSGIGLETARALGCAGARVVLTGRDEHKGRAAEARLRRTAGLSVEFEPLELGRLAAVETFVRRFRSTGRPLHLLINNAAILAPSLTYTEDGFEAHFGVNHLGHFALTTGLLPCLRAAGTARVIILSSRAHHHADVDFDDPNFRSRGFDLVRAYGQSKTANALFAVGLSNRLGIAANAVMPGFASTSLGRGLPPAQLAALGWTDRFGPARWRTVEQAAATTVWAAVAPELAGIGGLYLEDCAIARSWSSPGTMPPGHYRPYALDPERAGRLWALSESLVGR
jgi:NAD(P)-dependent dehydrogenase (short-subunit alcohol dehydrogenase family)